MRNPPKQLTSKQHSTWSATFLLAAVICTAIVFGQGDAPKAAAMIFTFLLGALCASHGAKSREKKVLEGIVMNDEKMRATQADYRQRLAELRKKQSRQ